MCVALLLALTACNSTISGRTSLAAELAGTALPVHALLATDGFNLDSYARATQENAPARIYIEGDGLAWLGSHQPSLNPTPTNPVALRLAALDTAPNVIWLARPCQYEGFSGGCSVEYWTSKRFAPEVIAAYQQALNKLKAQYHFSGFELVGFSGGGAVAALVAARRTDVINLRTVGGNIDHDKFNSLHHVSLMPESLNPRDDAAKLSHLPQLHFTGSKDDIVPSAVYDSYAQAAGNSACLHHEIVAGATHEDGWEEQWPRLLALPVNCSR